MSRCGLGERGAAAAGRLLEHSRWGSQGRETWPQASALATSSDPTKHRVPLPIYTWVHCHLKAIPPFTFPSSFLAAPPSPSAIRILDLSWNTLGRRGAQSLGEGLRAANTVEELHLAWTGITDVGASHIAKVRHTGCTARHGSTPWRQRSYENVVLRRRGSGDCRRLGTKLPRTTHI